MKKLDENESKKYRGGELTIMGIFGIGAIVTFISGIFDGFVRPLKCR